MFQRINRKYLTEEMEVCLPATMKVKLVRQMLMQKERDFYSGATRPGRMVGSLFKDHPLFLLKPTILIGMWRGGLFFSV